LFNIGPEELILILVVALIVFGPKRLPEIGRTVGKAMREFRKATQDIREEFTGTLEAEDEPPPAPSAASPGEPTPSETEKGASPDGASSTSLDGSAPTA